MDVKLANLLIDETKKSLNKLEAAEQKALAEAGEDSFSHPFLNDAGYQEAAQEIKLLVKQLEDLTGVKFMGTGTAYVTAASTAEFLEINLQAIQHVVAVLSQHRNDVPEHKTDL